MSRHVGDAPQHAGGDRRFERPWMKPVLLAAAVYNLVWGLAVIAFPNLLFDLVGAERPRYPELWQCIGMIVGVYGVGYAAAAFHPLRHWPVVLVGFLGKIFGPIGFVGALINGALPPAFGLTLLTNDLIWWAPFAALLWAALKEHATVDTQATPVGAPLADLPSTDGARTLDALSRESPVFVALLRHAGCTFHREALADLRLAKPALAEAGVELAVVHMGSPDKESAGGAPLSFEDPELRLYRFFELPQGRFSQLFGHREFLRGASACLIEGHGVGALCGDGFQLGGLALIDQGRVVWKRALESASERPDYVAEAMSALRVASKPPVAPR